MDEKLIEQFNVDFDQELRNQQEDYAAYQTWLGIDGNASKENLDDYYEWLENGGYEEIFNIIPSE